MEETLVYAPDGSVGDAPGAVNALPGRSSQARIAVLDNGKPGAASLMTRAAERLADRAGLRFVGSHRKGSAATPCEAELFGILEQEAEIILTGTAD